MEPKLKSYTVNSPISKDGKRYEITEPIELDPKEATPLLESGVISESEGEGEAKAKTKTVADT